MLRVISNLKNSKKVFIQTAIFLSLIYLAMFWFKDYIYTKEQIAYFGGRYNINNFIYIILALSIIAAYLIYKKHILETIPSELTEGEESALRAILKETGDEGIESTLYECSNNDFVIESIQEQNNKMIVNLIDNVDKATISLEFEQTDIPFKVKDEVSLSFNIIDYPYIGMTYSKYELLFKSQSDKDDIYCRYYGYLDLK